MPSAMSACAIRPIRAATCCRARAPRCWSSRPTFSNTPSNSEPVKLAKVRLYAERVIHGCIYQARSDVMAVCHHHAAAVMPFCVTGKPIAPVFHLGATIGEETPFWDQADEFGDTNLLVVKQEEGHSLARALGRHCGGADEAPRGDRGRRRIEGTGVALDLPVPKCRVSDAGAHARYAGAVASRRDQARRRHQCDARGRRQNLGILEHTAQSRRGLRPAARGKRRARR